SALAPGRSPNSGAKLEVRSSTDCVVSGDARFSVVPIAVIAGNEAPGREPGKALPPTPVFILTPSTLSELAFGLCPFEVNRPASLTPAGVTTKPGIRSKDARISRPLLGSVAPGLPRANV